LPLEWKTTNGIAAQRINVVGNPPALDREASLADVPPLAGTASGNRISE